jgi:hypothetical protein
MGIWRMRKRSLKGGFEMGREARVSRVEKQNWRIELLREKITRES